MFSLFAADFASMGSAAFVRSFACTGSVLPVISAAHFDSSPLLQSPARPGPLASPAGVARSGLASPASSAAHLGAPTPVHSLA